MNQSVLGWGIVRAGSRGVFGFRGCGFRSFEQTHSEIFRRSSSKKFLLRQGLTLPIDFQELLQALGV